MTVRAIPPSQPSPIEGEGFEVRTPRRRWDWPVAEAGEDTGGKTGGRGAVFLVAAGAEDFVHGAEREAAARQRAVDRIDPERQHTVPRRPLDPSDPLTQRAQLGIAGHIFGTPPPPKCCCFVLKIVGCQSARLFR